MTARKTRTRRSSGRPSTDRATAYAEAVIAGAIVAGPHVRNACRRHMQDLAVGHLRGLRYDVAAAEHVWTFFERAFRLSEGQFEGKPFALHPSQAFILGMIFGWKRADGMRRFRRAYIEQGKGNGKSPLAGGIGIYGMMADGEAGAQIYAAGARKEQAGILFQDACKMIRKSPLLSRRLRFSGGLGREFNVAHHRSGSFFRPISREAGKTGSGPRPHFALCDEVHEHPNRSVIEILERGFKFRRQPLLLMITNSGSDRKSLCREEHEHAVKVAAGTRTPDDAATYVGEVIDDDTFAYVCALDPGDDPLEDPSCWPKANPLLGVTVQHDYLAGVVRQAKDLPGALNGILRLHFCVWTDADRAWMSRATLEAVLADFDPAEHAGREVRLGIDLSATQDLTAMGAVVRTGTVSVAREDGATVELPTYDAWVEAWTPGDTLVERAVRDNAPYGVWAKDGWLNAPPGKTIRMDFMAARVAELQAIYRVTMLAYDAYAFRKHFEPQLDEAGVTIPLVEHPQGGKRRATPSEAQIAAAEAEGSKAEGLWMPGSVRELETLILERRIRIRRSPVVVSAMMSAVTESDPFDNRWFSKAKAVNRIDPLVALTIGVGATLADVGQEVRSPWEDPGFRLGSKG